jgi:VWFA-related protein
MIFPEFAGKDFSGAVIVSVRRRIRQLSRLKPDLLGARQACKAMFDCRSRRSTGLLAAAFVLLLNVRADGQDHAATPAIRSTTRVVTTNVVVTDRQGNPVRDLGEHDFVLLDGGQPQKIAFLSPVENEQAVLAPEPPPDTYFNSPALKGAPHNVTILLFDTLNARWAAQGYGLERVRKFLRQIRAEDRIGLYVLGDDLKVVHQFTRDASDVVAAISHYDARNSDSHQRNGTTESADDASLDQFLSGRANRYRPALEGRHLAGVGELPNSAMRRAEIAQANQVTDASLELIARQLSSFPGRKSLIWVSEDLGSLNYVVDDELDDYLHLWRDEAHLKVHNSPISENNDRIERMMHLMNDAGVAVYTVDARGLDTFDLGFPSTPNSVLMGSPVDAVNDLQARTPQPNTGMLELASRTGGRAFFSRNDLETGIRRALDDARLTYEVSYYPDHNQWKGEWRKIQVKVNRPDVTVLARGGYFALPDPRPVSGKNRYEFLSQIAASPIDSTQLPLSVHVATSSGAKGAQIEAAVHMNPQSMLTQQANGRWKGSFEVVFMQIGNKNKLLDLTQKDVDGDLDAKEYAAVSEKGWDLPAQLRFMPGANVLCVILRDKASDAVGSVRIPLERYATGPAAH